MDLHACLQKTINLIDTKYILCLAKPEQQKRTTKYSLEDDNVCGITTGGKENCEWDCIPSGSFYRNPECLIDCFDEDHCAVKAIKDYLAANGICKGSFLGALYSDFFPTSTIECEYAVKILLLSNNETIYIFYTSRGIFNEDSLQSLRENETCIYDVHKRSAFVYNTLQALILSSSDLQVFQNWFYFMAKFLSGFTESLTSIILPFPYTMDRLHPGFR